MTSLEAPPEKTGGASLRFIIQIHPLVEATYSEHVFIR